MTSNYNRGRHVRVLAREAVAIVETDPQLAVRDVAALVGVSPVQIYLSWRAAHPGRAPRGRRITDAMREAQAAPFALLCDVMLDNIPRRYIATAAEIFAATRRDYGSVHERRLWRALGRLVATGRVCRLGPVRSGAPYRRAA